MKKIFMFLAVVGLMAISAQNAVAQPADEQQAEQVQEAEAVAEPAAEVAEEVNVFNQKSDKPIYPV